MRAAIMAPLRSATLRSTRFISSRMISTVPRIYSISQTPSRANSVAARTRLIQLSCQRILQIRTFSSSLPTYSSSSSSFSTTSFPDSHRPDLFYHFLDPPTPLSPSLPAFALSFLPTPPVSPQSATILGWLPAQMYEADSSKNGDDLGLDKEQDAGLNDFHENQRFLGVLHKSIKSGLQDHVDDIWMNGAKQIQNGWMHIHDQRNIPALGRIGDPDDIIGSVLVKDSEIQVDTYQPMPSYRVCTADGPIQLTAGLAKRLHDSLTRLAEAEASANP